MLAVCVQKSEHRNPLRLALRDRDAAGAMFERPSTADLSFSVRYRDGDCENGERESIRCLGTGVEIRHYRIRDLPAAATHGGCTLGPIVRWRATSPFVVIFKALRQSPSGPWGSAWPTPSATDFPLDGRCGG